MPRVAILSLDEDHVCKCAPHPRISAEIATYSGYDPAEYWFLDDRQAAYELAGDSETDMLHDPLEVRPFSRQHMLEGMGSVDLSDVVAAAIRDAPLTPGLAVEVDPAERLQALGRHLVSLGHLRVHDLQEYLRSSAKAVLRRTLEGIERTRHTSDPAYVRHDVEQLCTTLRSAAAAEAPMARVRDHRQLPVVECASDIASVFRLFGSTLVYWPEMTRMAESADREWQVEL